MANILTRQGGKNRRRWGPAFETMQGTEHEIARRTNALRPLGLKADLGRLDVEEQHRIVALTWKDDVLDANELREWEGLAEKASEAPGAFKEARERAKTMQAAQEARRAVVRRGFSLDEEAGLFAAIGKSMANGFLGADHASLLMLICIAFEVGKPLHPKGSMKIGADGPILVVSPDGSIVPAGLDKHGIFSRQRQLVDHLEKNQWLVVRRLGRGMEIELGPRLVSAIQ